MGWTDQGNGFAFVPSVDSEIFAVHGEDAVAGIKFAHAVQAKIRQRSDRKSVV